MREKQIIHGSVVKGQSIALDLYYSPIVNVIQRIITYQLQMANRACQVYSLYSSSNESYEQEKKKKHLGGQCILPVANLVQVLSKAVLQLLLEYCQVTRMTSVEIQYHE